MGFTSFTRRVLFSSTSRTTDVKPAVPLYDIKRSTYSILTTALFFFDNFVVFPLVTARKQYFSAIYFVPKRFICSYLIRPYKKKRGFSCRCRNNFIIVFQAFSYRSHLTHRFTPIIRLDISATQPFIRWVLAYRARSENNREAAR